MEDSVQDTRAPLTQHVNMTADKKSSEVEIEDNGDMPLMEYIIVVAFGSVLLVVSCVIYLLCKYLDRTTMETVRFTEETISKPEMMEKIPDKTEATSQNTKEGEIFSLGSFE